MRDIITEGMHLRKIWTASIHFIFHIVKYYMELQPSKDWQPSLNYHMQSPTLQDCLKVCKMYPCYFFNYSMEHTEEQWMLTTDAMWAVQGIEDYIDENFYTRDRTRMTIQSEIVDIIYAASATTPPTTSGIKEQVRMKLWLHPICKSYIGAPHLPTHVQVRTVLEQSPRLVHSTEYSGVQTWNLQQ